MRSEKDGIGLLAKLELSMVVMALHQEMKSENLIIPLVSLAMWQAKKMKLEGQIMVLI